jgi:hypothetical protein
MAVAAGAVFLGGGGASGGAGSSAGNWRAAVTNSGIATAEEWSFLTVTGQKTRI